MRQWSRPARLVALLFVAAALALEVVAYLTYRDTVDGQAAVVNVAVLVYAVLFVCIVRAVDRAAGWFSRRP